MRHLVLAVPLVFLAACRDSLPTSTRPADALGHTGVRGIAADERRFTECQQPSSIGLAGEQRLRDPHELVRVTVMETGGQSLMFQSPVWLVQTHGGGAAAACAMWGRTGGGRGTIHFDPDSTRDTLAFVPIPTPPVQPPPDRVTPGRRVWAIIWNNIKIKRAGCPGCAGTDTSEFRYGYGSVIGDTLYWSLRGYAPRFNIGPARSDRDDIVSAFVAGCRTTQAMRWRIGSSDAADRQNMLDIGRALVLDNNMPVGKSTPYLKNWDAGVYAGMRSTTDCERSMLDHHRHNLLQLDPYIILSSPGGGGGSGGGEGFTPDGPAPRDPFDPFGPGNEQRPERLPLARPARVP